MRTAERGATENSTVGNLKNAADSRASLSRWSFLYWHYNLVKNDFMKKLFSCFETVLSTINKGICIMVTATISKIIFQFDTYWRKNTLTLHKGVISLLLQMINSRRIDIKYKTKSYSLEIKCYIICMYRLECNMTPFFNGRVRRNEAF